MLKTAGGAGLGLAVVARIVEQLGGQLRVDSKVGVGSRFSFLIPFSVASNDAERGVSPAVTRASSIQRGSSHGSVSSLEVDTIVDALSSALCSPSCPAPRLASPARKPGTFPIADSGTPVRPVKVDQYEMDAVRRPKSSEKPPSPAFDGKLRVLIVEVLTQGRSWFLASLMIAF